MKPKPKRPGKCGAKVWRVSGTYNLRRVIQTFESGDCTRRETQKRGKLALCTAHARMFDEGLVKEDGDTADPNTRRDMQRAKKRERQNIARARMDREERAWKAGRR